MQPFPNPDPCFYTGNIKKMLGDLIAHLREDINQIGEPKAQVLFETTAEVLTGLQTASRIMRKARNRACGDSMPRC